MAYSKTTWSSGDTITAAKLNNMESGISDNASDIEAINQSLSEYTTQIFSQPESEDLPNGITLGVTWACRLFKNNKTVNLRINANGTITSGGTFKTLFNIPSEFRPSGLAIINSYTSQDGIPMCIQIDANGDVSFYSSTGTSSIGFIFRQNLTWVIS